MRCLSCDHILSDNEATAKFAESGKFVDLCNRCISYTPDLPAIIDGSNEVEQAYEE